MALPRRVRGDSPIRVKEVLLLSIKSSNVRKLLAWSAVAIAIGCTAAVLQLRWQRPDGPSGYSLAALHVLACLAAAMPVAWHSLRTKRRLDALCEAAGRLASVDTAQSVAALDPVRRLEDLLSDVTRYQTELTAQAERISQGNLLADVATRSEHDAFGSSLATLVRKLRVMVGALETNCLAVSESARTVSDVVTVAVRAVNALSEWMTALSATARSASNYNDTLAEAVDDQTNALRAAMSAMETLESQVRAVSEGAREQAALAVSVGAEMGAASDIVEQAGAAALSLADRAGRAYRTAEEGQRLGDGRPPAVAPGTRKRG
jgi:methyl-accepting chemotaxis protein